MGIDGIDNDLHASFLLLPPFHPTFLTLRLPQRPLPIMRRGFLCCLLPLVQAISIISSNDDGWAEINIRALFKSLTSAGHSVVLSGPAHDGSGTGTSARQTRARTPTDLTPPGSLDRSPSTLILPCEFDSCPAGSPACGHNDSEPRLNYVNAHPLTSMRIGISQFAPKFFQGAPELAVAGPNVGSNLGLEIPFSGTAGAATYAAHDAGIPAIAFSGKTGSATAWDAATPHYGEVYAELATRFTNRLVASGTPYLPQDVWLNVNFPSVSDSSCTSPDDFHFVLSRLHFTLADDDVETCGSTRLPTETHVIESSGCYASVSVGMADDKKDANATTQKVVLDKLGSFLTCL